MSRKSGFLRVDNYSTIYIDALRNAFLLGGYISIRWIGNLSIGYKIYLLDRTYPPDKLSTFRTTGPSIITLGINYF